MRIAYLKSAPLLALLTVTLLMSVTLLILSWSTFASASSQATGPIHIVGDENFIPVNGVNGGGNGSASSPYIIENWSINASTAHGIWIENTTAHFIIRNCLVENGDNNYHGICLENVVNGRVENCISRNNDNGIWLHSSSNTDLDNNTCENNCYGLSLIESENIKMRGDILLNNQYNFHMDGSENSHFEHDIAHSDTTNGKSIVFLYGHHDEVIEPPMDVGYLMLMKCDNMLVRNFVFAYNGESVFLIHTTNSRVENCIFENNSFGLRLWHSSNNAVVNCTFRNNSRGTRLWHSSNNVLENNTCVNNSYGARLWCSSDNNTLVNNTFENNCYGISLHCTDNNTIHHNYLLNNTCNAYDDGTNAWDDGSQGNWWSDWQPPEHPDADGDGIVDENRPIAPCGNNQDNYPLVFIVRAVEVQIFLEYQSGLSCTTLDYTVTVVNKGSVLDIYGLGVSDDAGWDPVFSENSLSVPAGENRTATLSVTIPENTVGCTEDNIIVTATSQTDNASAEDSCIAHVLVVRSVEISIAPENQTAEPCNWLEYAVTVTNTGNVDDVYDLSVTDTLGWDNIWLEDNSLLVARYDGENSTTLHVHIPWCAGGDTWDNITITARSQADNGVENSDTCRAQVAVVRSVEVAISPPERSGLPGDNVSYTVIVKNTGNVFDNYDLSADDNAGWSLSLENTLLEIPRCENRTTTLTVTIPENAEGGTQDNVIVTVISQSDPSVGDSASCTAYFIVILGVEVSISPSYQEGKPWETLEYDVMIKNIGNVTDSYTLTAEDNAGWLGPYTQELIDVQPSENRIRSLDVPIPENVIPYTSDNIVVRATSHVDNTVSAENSAAVHVPAFSRGVGVSIAPTSQENIPGVVLNYIVLLTNEGDVTDNYALTASDNENWGTTVTPSSLLIPPGASDNAALSVAIPENAWAYEESTVVVTATSTENAEVSASDVGVAKTSVVRGVDVSIEPSENEALPGENLAYIVTITNTGNVKDTYDITVSDNAGWDPEFDLVRVELAPYGSAVVWYLKVTVPEDAVPGTPDNITVTAVSENDPTVRDNDSCIARAKVVREVEVLILENYQENENGRMLTYTVVIANTGNVPDSYALENIDTLGWDLSLSESLLENVEDGASENVTLTVAIPDNAWGCTQDNVTVIATSQENENVWDGESCLSHVKVVVRVDVRIEPSWQGHFAGKSLTYTVTVINIGNVPDNYILTIEDNTGWVPSLSENLSGRIDPKENVIVMLSVTIPENAEPHTEDNITVIAISQTNPEVSDNDWCIAHVILPKAEFSLITLYKVGLDVNLWIENGSKLVAKFYKYDNITLQAESVVDEFALPHHVENVENIPHPSGLPVEIVTLVLTTDNTDEVISIVVSFVVTKSTLFARYLEIKSEYPKPGADKTALFSEFLDVKKQFNRAPE